MSLNETLEATSAPDTLRQLAAAGSTGAVRFSGEAGCTVYLHRGHLYFARDEHTDEALATSLVRPGRLTGQAWSDAVTGAGDAPVVGELLVRRKAIEPDLLASVVLSVVYDPLIRLFRSGPVTHEFEPDTVHWLGPYRAFPVDAIVAEVEKRSNEVDEWSWLIPHLHVFVATNPTLPGAAGQVTLQREDWELVTALASAHSIAQLAARLGRGQYSTARVVHRLATAGLLTIDADVEPPLPARARPELRIQEDEADAAAPAAEDAPSLGDVNGSTDRVDPLDAVSAIAAEVGSGSAIAAEVDGDLASAGLAHRTPTALQPAGDAFHEPTDEEIDAAFGETDYEAMARWAGNGGQPDAAEVGAPAAEAPEQPAEPEPTDPNAVWLQSLYAKYIDDPEMSHALNGTKPKRGELNAHQVAFGAPEQSEEEKVGTLKRLMGALRRL